MVKRWSTHPHCKTEFDNLIADLVEKFGVAEETSEDQELSPGRPGSSGKRGSDTIDDLPAASPPPKKVKVDAHAIVSLASISEALLWEAKLNFKEAPVLQLRAGSAVYICNRSTAGAEVVIQQGAYLAGFGKGAFKLLKQTEAVEVGVAEFKLTSDSDLVVLAGAMQTLGSVIANQRKKEPSIGVCYHDLTVDTADPSKIILTTTHRVAFVPKSDDTITQANIAAKMPIAAWNNHGSAWYWAVRFTKKGLMPIKPVIHSSCELVLPAGRACKLSE
jgi:hypothetical protein